MRIETDLAILFSSSVYGTSTWLPKSLIEVVEIERNVDKVYNLVNIEILIPENIAIEKELI